MIEWRIVPSFPWLEASSDGRVRWRVSSVDDRKRKGTEIKGSKSSDGYMVIQIRKNGRCFRRNFGKHVLVCEAFHGPKPSPHHEVLHGDGVPDHNASDNLRWGTPKENAADRRLHGRDTVGMKHHSAKISDDDVIEIRFLKQVGFTGYGLGLMYGIDRNHANKIASHKAWPHVAATGDHLVRGALSFGA